MVGPRSGECSAEPSGSCSGRGVVGRRRGWRPTLFGRHPTGPLPWPRRSSSSQVLANTVPSLPVFESSQQRHDIPEGLMEGVGFRVVGKPEIGSRVVQERVSGLVGHDVGARAGIRSLGTGRVMEETETLAVVVGIQIDPLVGQEVQPPARARTGPLADLLRADGLVGLHRGESRLPRLPEEEVGGTGLVRPRRRPSDVGESGLSGPAVRSCCLPPNCWAGSGERIVGNEVDRHKHLGCGQVNGWRRGTVLGGMADSRVRLGPYCDKQGPFCDKTMEAPTGNNHGRAAGAEACPIRQARPYMAE